MLLLFDTSTTTAVVALAGPEGEPVIGVEAYPRREGGSSLLLTGAGEMLAGSGLDVTTLTGIVVNRGPGSYTGLRVGYALAQGLAEARGIDVAGIPSYTAFASQYRMEDSALCVCYDARSRGVAWVTFAQGEEVPLRTGTGRELEPEAVSGREVLEVGEERVLLQIAPAEALPGLIPRPCRIVGPGNGILTKKLEQDLPEGLELIEGSERVSPEHLFKLGALALAAGGDDPLVALPFYLGTMETPSLRSG